MNAPRRSLWMAVTLAAAVSVHAWSGARADAKVLVLVGDDAALHRALVTALSPWGISVVDVTDPSPGVGVPDAAAAGFAIASREHAVAVAWVGSSEQSPQEHALIVYDAASGRVIARRVARAPPFDDITAASLALSVKALLRHTAASPRTQRFGASDASGAPARGSTTTTPTAPTTTSLPSQSVVRVATYGGARLFRDGDASPELRVGLGLTFWPDAFARRFGVGVELAAGPGFDVDTRGLVARYVEAQVSVAGTLRALVIDAFALSFVGRLDLVLASLSGRFASADVSERGTDRVDVFRLDPQAALLVALDYEVGGARIGLRVGGTALVLRQRYTVRGEPVLSLPPVGLETALYVDFGF